MRLTVILPSLVLFAASLAFGQTDERMVTEPWPGKQWGETFDHLLYQEQGHLKDGSGNAQMFWWDSIGRFRLSTSDQDAPVLAYRYVTVNFDTHSPDLPQHLDKVSLAGGLHLGEFEGGKLGLVLGMGYSSDSPFSDVDGLFGIGHVTWDKSLNDTDSIIASVDYDGGSAFLSDIPLPGFQFVHRQEKYSYGLGFPRSFAHVNVTDRLSLEAEYRVPYTFDSFIDYKLGGGFSIFGEAADFFEAFYLRDESREDRFFQQMSRVEAGIRYVNADIFAGMSLDAALSIGYAFQQNFYRGFDVRDLDRTAEISDEPYIALILRGTF